MNKDAVKNTCNSCMQETWHTVEGTHKYTNDPDDYHCLVVHSVVKCRGCDTVSFRREFHDIDGAYLNDQGDWEVSIDVTNYPRVKKGSIKTDDLPKVVKEIYTETCSAYRDEAFTLAGMGFRATIEAICNHQGIVGKELSNRINNLAVKGLISKKDSSRLHSIRFLGNDAAHDIKKPSIENLDAALVIVEHLIATVYTLDRDSRGKLDEIIEVYEMFEKLLTSKLEDYNNGDEFPLQKYLGKDIRLINGSTKSMENALNARIGRKEFILLEFGKKEKYLNSSESLQHYKLTKP